MVYEIYNDAHLIPTYVAVLAFAFVLLYTALLTHELGHLLFFYIKKNKKVKFKWRLLKCEVGELKDYQALDDSEYRQVNMWGILAGVIPIVLAGLGFAPMYLIIVPYLFSIRQDLGETFEGSLEE